MLITKFNTTIVTNNPILTDYPDLFHKHDIIPIYSAKLHTLPIVNIQLTFFLL
jgi:hypothetical protein